MTIPMEIQHASEDFERFLADARDTSGLATRNQTYTMVQGVLQVFRRRLEVREALLFANALPPVLRAIFVADWNIDEPRHPFQDRASMTREVQSLRKDHNFAPDTAIQDVATALRGNMDEAVLNRVLAALPEEASDFWSAGS
ncbi:DUF2267 domain-containing protein [Microvirga pakistanensis]|uniref:DUF2267 domain-containing protein n=1 Tax=Microvirga pakistanensis TaxID=1682650 RepID=UPI00106CE142|nr:DUF2267 domain-containing protein [Microvirga pakistanensis]